MVLLLKLLKSWSVDIFFAIAKLLIYFLVGKLHCSRANIIHALPVLIFHYWSLSAVAETKKVAGLWFGNSLAYHKLCGSKYSSSAGSVPHLWSRDNTNSLLHNSVVKLNTINPQENCGHKKSKAAKAKSQGIFILLAKHCSQSSKANTSLVYWQVGLQVRCVWPVAFNWYCFCC